MADIPVVNSDLHPRTQVMILHAALEKAINERNAARMALYSVQQLIFGTTGKPAKQDATWEREVWNTIQAELSREKETQ